MEWLSLTLGLVGSVSGLAALALSWMTRRDLKQQSLLQAALEIEDAAPERDHRWMPGKVLLRNPAPFPVRVIGLALIKPGPDIYMALAEESRFKADQLVPSFHSGRELEFERDVPPASGGEILLFFGSTGRKTSQITCSVRLTYQEINDRRRTRTILITSNEATAIPARPRPKLTGSQDTSGGAGS